MERKKKLVETPGPISTELKIKEMNFQQRSIWKVVELLKTEANLSVADNEISHACKN